MLHKLWDDTVAGPRPEHGLGKLRVNTSDLNNNRTGGKYQRSISMPTTEVAGENSNSISATPTTPGTPGNPSPSTRKENVWRSVFHPGSNTNTKTIGAHIFDKPAQNTGQVSPTVYDWLYSGDSRSRHV
uniref:Auxin-repressed protein n=1 Tax=Limonium bicolor TaxID=293754 RepID=W6CRU7_9CARY|nr:auxin-repressed protein [Limonium bicolor]